MITIVASSTFLITVILLILWGVTEVILQNNPDAQFLSCQTFQLSFRVIETSLIIVIAYPFHNQQKRSSSYKSDDSESNSKANDVFRSPSKDDEDTLSMSSASYLSSSSGSSSGSGSNLLSTSETELIPSQ